MTDEYRDLKAQYEYLIDQIFACYEFNEHRRKHLSIEAREIDGKLNELRTLPAN
jgi:hypothetical protein